MPESYAVIDPIRHQRLIADLPNVCQTANVPLHMIKQSAKPFLTPGEMEWLANFPKHRAEGKGLVVVGVQSIGPSTKCFAIAGALIRNFIDARVITFETLVKALEKDHELSPTVMLIPNLFAVTKGKARPDWQVQAVYDELIRRLAKNKPTVAYVEDLSLLEETYGKPFAQHLTDDYLVVS